MKCCGRSANKFLMIEGLLWLAGISLVPLAWGQVNVQTWHNDAARTGLNPQETVLSPSNVNSTDFGLLFKLSVDGKVDAQPLYVSALAIASGTHNVLYVATENDTLYAFDADTGAQLWSQSLIVSGEQVSDLPQAACNQVTPTIGITSTPVIDLTSGPNGTIYVVAMTKDGSGHYHQRLHAIDIVTHAEEFGGPVNITGTYPGTGDNSSGGSVVFDPKQYKERAGLVLLNGVVYTSWASHCDIEPYTAWVIGYNKSTLGQTSVINLTPNGQKGSIWQAGAGPATDDAGNLYLLLANGTFDTALNGSGFPANGDYGNAFVKLSTSSGLGVTDYFTMSNTVTESNEDADLGSGGAMLLPTLNDAMGHPHALAVGAGKDGNAYVVDRNNMGKFNMSSNAVYQEIAVGATPCAASNSCIFSSPAWFNNTLYYGPNSGQLSAYPFSGGSFGTASSHTSGTFAFPGSTPSISSNGSSNGIVWAMENSSPAVLHAYDASDLTTELYNSNQAASSRDHFGAGNKFMTPTIANGKVFAAGSSSDNSTNVVGIFGPLACTYAVATSATFSSSAVPSASVGVTTTGGCSWSATTSSDFITITSGATGTGTGSVGYSIPENLGTARTGFLVVAGHVFKITQNGSNTLGVPASPSPTSGATGVSINPTLSWTAATGATSYDVYFGTSSTPVFVTNTVSTNYTPSTLTAGITYYWRVVSKNSSGSDSSAVWNFTTGSTGVPTADSVTPNSGSGASQNFALQYSDTGGTSSLQQIYVLINSTLTAGSSCELYYLPGANQIGLLNDAGTAWSTSTPGASGVLQNSQCSVNVATSTRSLNGNTLALNFAMSFAGSYSGARNVYMWAGDVSGAKSGWQQRGTWTVTSSSGVATANSVTPNSGSGSSQTFALQYGDTAGASNLQQVYALFNSTLTSSSSCELYYQPGTNQVGLLNDGATAWTAATLGSTTTLQNSQCWLNVAASTKTLSGNNLTLNFAMAFTSGYAGAKKVYMWAGDLAGSNSAWQQRGTWTASATPGVPAANSVTPSSGSGSSQNFALSFSDTAGASSLQQVYAIFSSTLSSTSSCELFYQPGINQLGLLNDAATAWMVATPGASTTLQNSQCALNVAATTKTLNGNSLTVNLALTFAASYTGAKNVYLWAGDGSGSKTGWQQLGTWTVGGGVASASSVTPSSGSGLSRTFALLYSDTAGASSIQQVYTMFSSALSSANSCELFYLPGSNQVGLLNDAASAWSVATLGASTTLQNSQCSLSVGASSKTLSGNNLTLNVAMTFAAGYAGTKNLYLWAGDVSATSSGWQQLGTWTVP
jgi:hypothetical protein